jgi:hypothetical protein
MHESAARIYSWTFTVRRDRKACFPPSSGFMAVLSEPAAKTTARWPA